MRLNFCFNTRENNLYFFCLPQRKYIDNIEVSVEPLPKLFGYTDLENLPFYNNLLNEIALIEKNGNEVFEDSYDVGGGLSFELKITKEATVCETWTTERKVLELPTSEFKELVTNWIKFVEVNTAAFGNQGS